MLKLKIKRIIRNSLVLIKLYHISRYINRKKAIILMYHNFCREGDIKHTNVSLSITNFEKQIKYLKKYYRIVPLADLVGKIKRKEDFLPHSVAITFDDGYKNNFLLAYPLIKKYNVPVTIFLTAGYINTKKFLWVNELEYAINETQKKEISITFGCCNFKYFIKTKAEKMRVYEQLKEKLKKLENSQLRAVLDKILLRLKVKIDYDDAGNYQMLTWDEIFEMRNGYVSYGNHTFSHSILT
ncbi:polysaccharide deacetylase family protein, partial [bacterium]|nr:polysaccharide deacetylase family protein [bacterium]